jgi:hypothetical protein
LRGDDIKANTIYAKFRLGDVVYHKLCKDKWPGIVTGLLVRPTGTHFFVAWGDNTESQHYDLELTAEFVKEYDTDNAEDD